EDFPLCQAGSRVESRDFSSTWQSQQLDATLCVAFDNLVCAVGRAVRGNDNLQTVGRVVERERVFQLLLDDTCLIVCSDNQADAGGDIVLFVRAGQKQPAKNQNKRETNEDVDQHTG